MTWDDLNAQTQADLEEWYNRTSLDDEDRARLAELVDQGKFYTHTCPNCDDRALIGEPDDWADFQGVRQGENTDGELCASCWGKMERLRVLHEG